ncbi:MAG: OmpA family protein [Chitinophagales bacterium]|nr:OmpA family protein [Chitinophagales bacterium]
MKKIATLTFCAFVFNATVYAQVNRVSSKNIGTELKIADKFYAESYFYTAAEYYRDAVRQDSTSRYATFWLAMSLLQSRDYENAEVFFEKFYSMKPGEKDNAKKWAREDEVLFNKGGFYYGQVLHRNGKYDLAIQYLNKFKSTYKAKDENDLLPALAKRVLDGCEFARNNPMKAKVKVLNAGPGVNRSYNEGSPFGVGEDQLYYSSIKVDGMSTGDTLIFVKGPKSTRIYQIYKSTLAGNEWGKGKPIDNAEINDPKYIVGNGVFNAEMTRFYFTKCLEMDDDRSLCNIFVADHSNGTFSNVQRIPDPINEKEKYTSTQPTVRSSRDGMEIIYFVSDRPGGAGGMDIWYFTREVGGDFKGPKVLKGGINTAGDELTPYFCDSISTLYFSSDGHPGYGGLDVFRSVEGSDLSWGPVINMGAPVNSGADDLYYTRSTDQTKGFLVSNRVGSVPLNGIKTASDDIFTWSNFNFAVQGIAFKEGNEGGGALEGATFKLYRKAEDGTQILVAVDSVRKDGSYFFKLQPETDYVVEVERPGFTNKFEAITTKGLLAEDTLNNNINIRKASFILKGLVANESKPGEFVKDASITLVEVYPNGMEKTVYYMNSDPYFYFEVEKNKKYKIVARKNEYFAKTIDLNTSGYGNVDTITKEIAISKLEINKEYTLQNVLYEFGKATLTESSKEVLNNLYQIMVENPAFIVELSAHTDHIGSDAANMKLSQARAESCVKYLIEKGIAKDRLVAKGYGESRPKVPNLTEDGKDDPAGRAINRRTEFKIIGLKQDQ